MSNRARPAPKVTALELAKALGTTDREVDTPVFDSKGDLDSSGRYIIRYDTKGRLWSRPV